MYALIRFLIRHQAWVVFLFLEGISYALIVQANPYQREVMRYTWNYWQLRFDRKFQSWQEYLELKDRVDTLLRENARLRRALLQLQQESKEKTPTLAQVEARDTSMFSFVPARVISKSIGRRHNTFIIDRGKADGVTEGMGVIAREGVVGVVQRSSDHFSLVLSVFHPAVRISARIAGTDHIGLLRWSGDHGMKYFILEDIPKFARFAQGDTVVTSGYSLVYPPDVVLGTIESARIPEGSALYEIKVRGVINPVAVHYVYVFRPNRKAELDSLLGIRLVY